MLDVQEYTTQDNDHQGNGYNHLPGDWALYYKVAKGFTHRVKPEDRQDFLHDLLLTMAKVKAKYNIEAKPLTEAGLIRIACFEVADYWRKTFKQMNGHDCGRCNQQQRRECKEREYRECPKAVKLDSLDRLIEDGEGNQVELCQMIADDTAIDVIARLDARLTLQGYPHRFIRIAYKKYAGYPLSNEERNYLYRQRSKVYKISQKSLAIA
jgi:hypothetical protein